MPLQYYGTCNFWLVLLENAYLLPPFGGWEFDPIACDYQILLIIAGIDTLKDRREVLCESFLRDMFYLLAHYFIVYFRIAMTMTLLAA